MMTHEIDGHHRQQREAQAHQRRRAPQRDRAEQVHGEHAALGGNVGERQQHAAHRRLTDLAHVRDDRRLHEADAQAEQHAGHVDVRQRGGTVQQRKGDDVRYVDQHHGAPAAHRLGQPAGQQAADGLGKEGDAACGWFVIMLNYYQ